MSYQDAIQEMEYHCARGATMWDDGHDRVAQAPIMPESNQTMNL